MENHTKAKAIFEEVAMHEIRKIHNDIYRQGFFWGFTTALIGALAFYILWL